MRLVRYVFVKLSLRQLKSILDLMIVWASASVMWPTAGGLGLAALFLHSVMPTSTLACIKDP